MIGLLAHRCRSTNCGLGWLATARCLLCPFCSSTDVLVGGQTA